MLNGVSGACNMLELDISTSGRKEIVKLAMKPKAGTRSCHCSYCRALRVAERLTILEGSEILRIHPALS